MLHLPKEAWCGREDSNFHGVIPHKHLKLARLPFRHGRPVTNDQLFLNSGVTVSVKWPIAHADKEGNGS